MLYRKKGPSVNDSPQCSRQGVSRVEGPYFWRNSSASSGRFCALMEQFAALKQKAMEARDLNVEFMTSFERSQNGSPSSDPYADPVWDVSAAEAERQFPSKVENVNGEATEEERSYIKAVSSKKRGDDALVDHLNKKVRVAEKRSGAQNFADPDVTEMEGVPLSDANARFNRRFWINPRPPPPT